MDEFDETYALQLSNLVNVLPGTVVGTGTITDDDASPTVVDLGRVRSPRATRGRRPRTFTRLAFRAVGQAGRRGLRDR